MNCFYLRRLLIVALTIVMAGCSTVQGAEPDEAPLRVESEVSAPGPQIEQAVPQVVALLPGRFVFGRNGGLWTLQANIPTPLQTKSGVFYTQASWAPDGTSILAVEQGTNHSDIVVLTATGMYSRTVTQNLNQYAHLQSSWAMFPTWSPDGKYIAYISDSRTSASTGRVMQLFVVTPDNILDRGRPYTFDQYAAIESPKWSPDGKTILFTAWPWQIGAGQLITVEVATGNHAPLTSSEQGVYDGSWSPDGKRIAYVQRNNGKHDIWIMDAGGKNPVQVTSNGINRQPIWIDERTLAYLAVGPTGAEIWSITLNEQDSTIVPSKPQQHTTLSSNSREAIDASGGLSWVLAK